MRFDEETKGADSSDKVRHNKRSDQLFLERMMKVAEQHFNSHKFTGMLYMLHECSWSQ